MNERVSWSCFKKGTIYRQNYSHRQHHEGAFATTVDHSITATETKKISDGNVDEIWMITQRRNKDILVGALHVTPNNEDETKSIKGAITNIKDYSCKKVPTLGNLSCRHPMWGDH